MITPFPERPRIIIRDGMVAETRYHNAAGVTVTLHDPPKRRFFLDYDDGKGGYMTDLDGRTYSDACAAAREWQRDGIFVDDRVNNEWERRP